MLGNNKDKNDGKIVRIILISACFYVLFFLVVVAVIIFCQTKSKTLQETIKMHINLQQGAKIKQFPKTFDFEKNLM